MLAVTSYVSTDIASVPLLWIVPLALYLLTFAYRVRPAIGHGGRASSRRALPILVVPLALFMISEGPRAAVSAIVLLAPRRVWRAIALNCHVGSRLWIGPTRRG